MCETGTGLLTTGYGRYEPSAPPPRSTSEAEPSGLDLNRGLKVWFPRSHHHQEIVRNANPWSPLLVDRLCVTNSAVEPSHLCLNESSK